MSRARIWSLAALAVVGCESGEVPERGAQPEPPTKVYVTAPPRPEPRVDPPIPEPEAEVEVPTLEEVDEEEERDLGAELKEAIGVPLDCVQDFRADQATTLRISVSGTVRPSGIVIMPSAYGYGLSTSGRACIEQRVSTVVLRPLDQKTSERVSTTVEVDFEPGRVLESQAGTPDPVLRNTRDPLPPRREVAPSGRPIQDPTSREISGGFDGGRPIQEPTSRKVRGPQPRPIDGYDVDENAQEWR